MTFTAPIGILKRLSTGFKTPSRSEQEVEKAKAILLNNKAEEANVHHDEAHEGHEIMA